MKSHYKQLGSYIRVVDKRNKELKVELLLGVSVKKVFIPSVANTVGTDFKKYVSQHITAVSPLWASRFQLFNLEENALNPLIILIGGTPGIGKSTLANLVARRFKATNLLGTDILREILRGIISTSF